MPLFRAVRRQNDTRVFLSGNPDEPDCDWQSGLYDPTYFPDTGYTRMGTDASVIVGYLKQYESQVVVKSGGAQEATSYLRTYMMADDGSALYPLKQGAQGEGAISSRCFAVLNDLPLYLLGKRCAGRVRAPPLPNSGRSARYPMPLCRNYRRRPTSKTPVRWYSRANIIWQ